MRDYIFTREIKIKDLINPPLRQSSFTDAVFSAQLSSTERQRGIWLGTTWEPLGNLGGLGAGDSQGESDGSSDGQGELEDYPGSHDKE